ncbi:hypothetical protein F503_00092 [Ophiostoma piceae UAMH 11346]|uniref:Uncharacterized protein n=1 Tax=Ophiostoma piceae (strain UAMH 11346) TaxID=1262450 RepID=S3CF45_OPHP1|nr:hypothetical protein F503_00092 [Ophiostoma piceae UAMH 11346]
MDWGALSSFPGCGGLSGWSASRLPPCAPFEITCRGLFWVLGCLTGAGSTLATRQTLWQMMENADYAGVEFHYRGREKAAVRAPSGSLTLGQACRGGSTECRELEQCSVDTPVSPVAEPVTFRLARPASLTTLQTRPDTDTDNAASANCTEQHRTAQNGLTPARLDGVQLLDLFRFLVHASREILFGTIFAI